MVEKAEVVNLHYHLERKETVKLRTHSVSSQQAGRGRHHCIPSVWLASFGTAMFFLKPGLDCWRTQSLLEMPSQDCLSAFPAGQPPASAVASGPSLPLVLPWAGE